MPIFEELTIQGIADWAAAQIERPLIDTFVFAAGGAQVAVSEQLVQVLNIPADVNQRSGAVRWTATPDNFEELLNQAMDLAHELDPEREWVDSQMLEGGENPSTVLFQNLSILGGLLSLGPGGRVTLSQFGDRLIADVTVRHRIGVVQSQWENPGVVRAAARTLLDNDPGDTRLRGAFGYAEPSRYEASGFMRPVYVLLLDRPEAIEGPRWRVEAKIPATRIIEEDLPPWLAETTPPGACV